MSHETQSADTPAAHATSPFIHVAGDLIVRLGSRPLHNLAHMLVSPLQDHFANIIGSDGATPLKIMADGKQVDAREPVTDHVALLFPDTGWMVAVTALSNGGRPFDSQQAAEAAGKALRLLDYDNWELATDKVYERHVIDRRFHEPAADKNLYPNLPLSDWYWTSTAAPWSSGSAFGVALRGGGVNSAPRGYGGFGLACRRARQ